jgi:hypothetical protein
MRRHGRKTFTRAPRGERGASWQRVRLGLAPLPPAAPPVRFPRGGRIGRRRPLVRWRGRVAGRRVDALAGFLPAWGGPRQREFELLRRIRRRGCRVRGQAAGDFNHETALRQLGAQRHELVAEP